MKKFLLTAALVLALVTSLTAGTMAYYSTTVATIESEVISKDFSFTADHDSKSWKTGVEIAPGDTLTYEITVKNDSEVQTAATFAATLTKGFDAAAIGKDGLTVTVTRKAGVGTVSGDTSKSGAASVELSTTMGLRSSAVYTVTVAWARGEAFGQTLTQQLQGKTITLDIDINGEQIIDANTIDMLQSVAAD